MIELSSIFALAAYGGAALTLGITAIAAIKSTFFTNKQQQEALITRFGKLVRTEQNPGLHVKIPFIDKVAERIGTDLQQKTETLETKTKDDLFVELPISVQFVIEDTAKYFYKNREGISNMLKAVSAAVRTATAEKDFQELFGDRDGISNAVIEHTKNDAAKYGIRIEKIIIDQPNAPADVQKAYNEVRASERLKEAARNKAEAHRIEVVTKSEADATAQANAGRGAADFRRAILDGYRAQIDELTHDGKVGREEALHIVMRSMELDALREVAQKGNLVIVPQALTTGGNDGLKDLTDVSVLKGLLDRKPANDGKGHAPSVPSLGSPG